jgi:(1->4)-alpha-D-glucan 1-alpha-D-glucosylmutase
MIPRATMRVQLHQGFPFAAAAAVAPYLAALGISHVYSSPILTARPGSIHGYDVIDATTVNPELGGEAGFRDFVAALRQAGLGLIVDIVPNHMAVDGNRWWNDVLRCGRGSRYAGYFDIDWDDPGLGGKVLAPFLGLPYGAALAAGEIRLERSASGEPVVRYFDQEFPVGPEGAGSGSVHEVLERQHYRLAWWGVAGDEINWRRFFDINGLAALRMEDPAVFEATHATLLRLYGEGLIDGFRVDHVDGLADPGGYCRRLRRRLADSAPGRVAYLVVEKILASGERLPTDWGVDGTSGYDFLNQIGAVQHDSGNATFMERLWHEATGRPGLLAEEEVAARREVVELSFEAPLRAVVTALDRMARSDCSTRDISAAAIRRGLITLLAHFPAYRCYPGEQAMLARALAAAKAATRKAAHPVLEQLGTWLGGAEVAATRFQQLCSAVAAKAVEDTAFYRYGRLLSRNDVGCDAGRLGGSVADFHRDCAERRADFPAAMLATATHDHKRGEDLRARLAVISEVPEAWADFLARCERIGGEVPDPGDRIMLYQMIVGAWPPLLRDSDESGVLAFAERLAGWQRKALREAKLRSDWVVPNETYERVAADFLFRLFAPDGAFLPLVRSFVDLIAPAGAVNGLAQMVLKLTTPGVPDVFQGTEFWDFSLVDPDNRRAVDYDARLVALAAEAALPSLLAGWRDGRIKQAVMRRVLALRRRLPEVFALGDYCPLAVSGRLQPHVVAFSRSHGAASVIVVAPLLVHRLLLGDDRILLDPRHLQGSALRLPEPLQGRRFVSLLSDNKVVLGGAALGLRALIGDFPLAVLHTDESA